MSFFRTSRTFIPHNIETYLADALSEINVSFTFFSHYIAQLVD